VPVKVAVPEPAMAKAAAVKNMRGSEAAAVKRRAATMEACTVEAAAVEAAATMAASAMPAASLDGQPVRGVFRGGRHARIDQRKRLCALASYGRQRKHRGSRNAQATDKTALGIWNLHHLWDLPESGQQKAGPWNGLLSACSFAIAPNIKLTMTMWTRCEYVGLIDERMRVDERMRDATITTKTMVIAQLKIRHRAAYDCSGVLLRCVQKIQWGLLCSALRSGWAGSITRRWCRASMFELTSPGKHMDAVERREVYVSLRNADS
jgi:hypothetical protein